MEDWKDIVEDYFPLHKGQEEMIQTILYPSDSNPFHVEARYSLILRRVLRDGFYTEEDKALLNYVRECYLQGKNWVK